MPIKRATPAPAIGDAAVFARTGKTWPEWFAVLDKAHAAQMNHQQIVAYLVQRHAVGPWWQQMITVTYEQARGLRAKHQRPEGFAVSVGKTIAVPAARVFESWKDARTRARWLARRALTVRKATPNKSLRITWGKRGESVDVELYARPGNKTQVSVQHSKLANAAAAARQKAFWNRALVRLKTVLETPARRSRPRAKAV